VDNKITWSNRAINELEAIFEYIARDSKDNASSTAENIKEQVKRLNVFPESGRIVPEIGNPNIREIIYKSYRIVYRIESINIVILTVRHAARKGLGLN
jgi:toxin ParE1/3/4